MPRDINWEKFWSTGSVLDYLAYRKKQEYICPQPSYQRKAHEGKETCCSTMPAASCVMEAKNEIDHPGSDYQGTDRRRKG